MDLRANLGPLQKPGLILLQVLGKDDTRHQILRRGALHSHPDYGTVVHDVVSNGAGETHPAVFPCQD